MPQQIPGLFFPSLQRLDLRWSNTGNNRNSFISMPFAICPFRFEVLFWGLRDLKRVQFLTVDKPRVDVECGGHIIQVVAAHSWDSSIKMLTFEELCHSWCEQKHKLLQYSEVLGHRVTWTGDVLSTSVNTGRGLQVEINLTRMICIFSFMKVFWTVHFGGYTYLPEHPQVPLPSSHPRNEGRGGQEESTVHY